MKLPWKILMYADEIGLDEDQIEKIRDALTNLRKEKVKSGCKIELAKIDLQSMMMREDVNMPDAEAKIREMTNVKGDMGIAWIRTVQEIRTTLTPEQRAKVKAWVKSFFKHGGMGEVPMEPDEAPEPEELE
jgi:Spy/CpxP family protein refolding chaperone